MLKYDEANGWREGCGCSGKPLSKVTLPADSAPVIFVTPTAQYVVVNGHRYHAKRGLIAVDVRDGDIAALGNRARLASPTELTRLTGYRSRA
jgi:hypothetical protein